MSKTTFVDAVVVALELSGRQGSVAIGRGGRVLVERTFEHGLRHAAGVVPLVEASLREQGLSTSDVGGVAVSGGPGSFTGLRISITLAKTWRMAADMRGTPLELVLVPTARVLAENMADDVRLVSTMLDAKRGQVFSGSYAREAGGGWQELRSARLIRLDELLGEAKAGGWCERYGRHVLVGEGIAYHLKPGEAVEGAEICDESLWRASAGATYRVALEMAGRGEVVQDADAMVPIYVRLPEAEEKYQAALGAK